ncbi:MAG TPA: acyl carrier protein [Lachnospiraceae bacterium]|jgi:acyl carrier protein|nr:acyl carrier protein [Lachnospiraceae bacterium]HBW54994.1 acyl carrier protein [Lachnospiraceae bacterium]
MSNKEKYVNAFVEALEVSADQVAGLKYQEIPNWDSVGHMGLIAAIEDAFDIMMDTDDIIDLSSFEKGMEILSKNYDIEF